MFTRTLQQSLLAASMCCLVASVNAVPFEDALNAEVKGDYKQALKIYRALAAQGDAAAQSRIGYMYQEGNGVTRNYQEALKWFRLAADIAKGSAKLTNKGNFAVVRVANANDPFDPMADKFGNFLPLFRGQGLSVGYDGMQSLPPFELGSYQS